MRDGQLKQRQSQLHVWPPALAHGIFWKPLFEKGDVCEASYFPSGFGLIARSRGQGLVSSELCSPHGHESVLPARVSAARRRVLGEQVLEQQRVAAAPSASAAGHREQRRMPASVVLPFVAVVLWAGWAYQTRNHRKGRESLVVQGAHGVVRVEGIVNAARCEHSLVFGNALYVLYVNEERQRF